MKFPLKSEIASRHFGIAPGGQGIEAWTLTGAGGLQIEAISYGAIITRLLVPNRDGRLKDVVLGFSGIEPYLEGSAYFGAAIGRVAGRISNASFTLDGRPYDLVRNDGANHLHGGDLGFDKKIWNVEAKRNENGEPLLVFLYTSLDGEEGYPGAVQVKLTYTVTGDNKLIVDIVVKTDRATPFNFTQHSYFNLAGEGSGSIADHVLQVFADEYVPADDNMRLIGRFVSVEGQGNDFRQPRRLEDAIPALFQKHGDLYRVQFPSYVSNAGPNLKMAARLVHPESGRMLEVATTEEYLQLYTGVGLDGSLSGKSGISYGAHSGLCLECQGYPDGANHPEMGDIILRPGYPKRATTVYGFSHITQENDSGVNGR